MPWKNCAKFSMSLRWALFNNRPKDKNIRTNHTQCTHDNNFARNWVILRSNNTVHVQLHSGVSIVMFVHTFQLLNSGVFCICHGLSLFCTDSLNPEHMPRIACVIVVCIFISMRCDRFSCFVLSFNYFRNLQA